VTNTKRSPFSSFEKKQNEKIDMLGHILKPRWWHAVIILTSCLLAIMAATARAEDKLGNWLGVNRTIRFSDHWSAFAQGELRLWEPASKLNETLFRFAGHYDFNKIAMVGLGYVRADTWPFEDGDGRIREENRLYVAGGHQFTADSNLQLGLMRQARPSEDFFQAAIYLHPQF
jgi:hypothetical protein